MALMFARASMPMPVPVRPCDVVDRLARMLRPVIMVCRMRNVRKMAGGLVTTVVKVFWVFFLVNFTSVVFGVMGYLLFSHYSACLRCSRECRCLLLRQIQPFLRVCVCVCVCVCVFGGGVVVASFPCRPWRRVAVFSSRFRNLHDVAHQLLDGHRRDSVQAQPAASRHCPCWRVD